MKKTNQDNFTDDLIKSLNKEHGSKIAYNLAYDESPTHVNRWISTGSRQLDYIIANRRDGGLPVRGIRAVDCGRPRQAWHAEQSRAEGTG